MGLPLDIPVYFSDSGPSVAHAKPWYQTLLRAHRVEMEATFDALTPAPAVDLDTAWIARLPTPSVLVLPALCGGWVDKDWGPWWRFRGHLREYRGAGGVVVCLDKAFNLPADGRRAAGRGWEGFETDAARPGLAGRVSLVAASSAIATRAELDTVEVKAWSEWKRNPRWSDSRGAPAAWVTQGDAQVPVAWRWAREAWEEPGVMLFLSTLGWLRRDILDGVDWLRDPSNLKVVDRMFTAYRALNRALVEHEVRTVLDRRQARTRRLERLAGETVRLPNRVGKEKDYHRLLVNDSELCVDIVGWRALVDEDPDGLSRRFRKTFRHAAVANEPAHAKAHGGRGRLDILLAANADAEQQGDAYLAERSRGPVAWIELEAGPIHRHQIEAFLGGQGAQLRAGDFVCAVDRSADDDPAVSWAREQTEACGATFLHAQVPQVFARLEEAYAPAMHRLSRKRYALEVIRGLLG
ncbi:MAG: hypothetical protein H6742_14855 [Alphaproteobacteria bacterium]|nr:hypothetical protein [Alphaproteobacteria bacterium]